MLTKVRVYQRKYIGRTVWAVECNCRPYNYWTFVDWQEAIAKAFEHVKYRHTKQEVVNLP